MFHRRTHADATRAARHVCSRVSGKGVSKYRLYLSYIYAILNERRQAHEYQYRHDDFHDRGKSKFFQGYTARR